MTSSDDGTIRVFDLKSGHCLYTFFNHRAQNMTCMAMHPQMNFVVAGNNNSLLYLLKTEGNKQKCGGANPTAKHKRLRATDKTRLKSFIFCVIFCVLRDTSRKRRKSGRNPAAQIQQHQAKNTEYQPQRRQGGVDGMTFACLDRGAHCAASFLFLNSRNNNKKDSKFHFCRIYTGNAPIWWEKYPPMSICQLLKLLGAVVLR